jgi:hypothetical protein
MKAAFVALALALAACGGKSAPQDTPPDPEPEAACVVGGCSGQLCVEEGGEGGMSTCEWQDAYACYQSAFCERQADGACGWTQTEELAACLADPPAPDQPAGI